MKTSTLKTCNTCCHASSAPYRQYGEKGEILAGCVDSFHDHSLVCDKDAAWHSRPEAVAIRATAAAHLARVLA